MSVTTWPPPPGPTDSYRHATVFDPTSASTSSQQLREVNLWGSRVLYDDDTARVYCHACAQLINPDELRHSNNSHPIAPIGHGLIDLSNQPDHDDPGPSPMTQRW